MKSIATATICLLGCIVCGTANSSNKDETSGAQTAEKVIAEFTQRCPEKNWLQELIPNNSSQYASATACHPDNLEAYLYKAQEKRYGNNQSDAEFRLELHKIVLDFQGVRFIGPHRSSGRQARYTELTRYGYSVQNNLSEKQKIVDTLPGFKSRTAID